MESIPMEWIDKLFNCMEQFYGKRWSQLFNKLNPETYHKIMWKNGLVGLNYEQIKNALLLCKRSALHPWTSPPHVMEFWRIAKGKAEPYIDYHPKANEPICNKEIQRQAMHEIKRKLGISIRS
jgi:hypothetical protein